MINMEKVLYDFGQNLLSNLKCSEICKVEKVNTDTIDCRPVTDIFFQDKQVQAPLLTDVPVFIFQGGNSYEAFPIQIGDYVLVVFVDKNTDNWALGANGKTQREFRFHDINDGFAFCGFNPLKSRYPIPTLIYRKGNSKHDGDNEQNGDYTHVGKTTEEGDTDKTGNTKQTGNITASGTITAASFAAASEGATMSGTITLTGDIIINGVSLKTFVSSHRHTAPSGGGTTSAPIN
jgi:hypothetical protein